MKPLLVLVVVLVAAPAAAAVDCAALTTTMTPYEIEMRNGKGAIFAIQVFRDKNLRRTQVTKTGTRVTKTTYQANFELEVQSPPSKPVTFRYDAPTDRYTWDSRTASVEVTPIDGDTAKPGYAETFHSLGQETTTLDGCSLQVQHYEADVRTGGFDQVQEIWFAPQIASLVRMKSRTTMPGGKTLDVEMTASGLRTAFEPFR